MDSQAKVDYNIDSVSIIVKEGVNEIWIQRKTVFFPFIFINLG